MSFFGIPVTPPQQFYRISDWGAPVPQRTLRALGLDPKFAVPKAIWPMAEAGQLVISPDSFPMNEALVGDSYTAEQLWLAVPAFHDNYATPVAMLWALLKG